MRKCEKCGDSDSDADYYEDCCYSCLSYEKKLYYSDKEQVKREKENRSRKEKP